MELWLHVRIHGTHLSSFNSVPSTFPDFLPQRYSERSLFSMDMITTINWSRLPKSLGPTSYTPTSINTTSVSIHNTMNSSEGILFLLGLLPNSHGSHLDILENHGHASSHPRTSGTSQTKPSICWINYSVMTIRSV